MPSYTERARQAGIRKRLEARNNGFARFEPADDATICSVFDRQVSLHAGKQAIVGNDGSLTYEQLDRLVHGVAGLLRDAAGDDVSQAPIAVLIADPVQFVASILAILRIGAAYVPVDPEFPEERSARILQQSRARYIVTARAHQEVAARLALSGQVLLHADDAADCRERWRDESRPGDLACIIFTSGSTGQPKGVMQTHRNLLQVVRRLTHSLYLGFEDRVCLLSSCSVTASIGTIFGSLLNGATLCAFAVRQRGLARLADWLDAERITIYRSVPSLFRHLLQSVAADRVFPTVQIVRLGGDSLHRSDWQLFGRFFSPDCVFANYYGCSELSTAACFYMDSGSQLADGVLPVGYPLDDVEVGILDNEGRATWLGDDAHGVNVTASAGEIVLRSRYLSQGYWDDATASEAAFKLVDWAKDGRRMYRTGDLGAARGDQGLVHVGRGDSQAKVSGFRVEIAEVEAALRVCEGVEEAAVVFHTAGHGERELVGFARLAAGQRLSAAEIRSQIARGLPPYMVPSEVVLVDRIPYTPNGKIDRAALLVLRQSACEQRQRRAARTATEKALAEIWIQVLEVQDVGVDDNFFALGGNSLIGMKLAVRVASKFAVSLQALAVFHYPTISEMAQFIDKLADENQSRTSLAGLAAGTV